MVNQHILFIEYTSLLFYLDIGLEGVVMVFNATFNNISWRSDLLLEETGVSGENHVGFDSPFSF